MLVSGVQQSGSGIHICIYISILFFSDSFIGDIEDGEEYDDPFAGPPDTISLASERYDKDDEAHSDGMWHFPIEYTSWHSNTKQCDV